MKRKLLSMLVLLMTAISVAWGQEESYLYLEVNSGNNTAVLKYGQVPDNTPYYVGGDNNVWSGDPAKSSVTTITVDASCQDFAGTSLINLFFEFTALTTINDLEYLNTANVENMSFMFYECGELTSLDVSGWNTAKVTDMGYMFGECSSLASLDVSGWNTEKVTRMSGIFMWCKSLTSLNVSGWNTEIVTSMKEMFHGCSKLASLDLSGWNTGSVINMLSMFSGCSSLASLDLSGWNTENVENMAYMFNDCSKLPSLDLSGWNTAKVTNMHSMFKGCSGLASLDLSGWNTGNVTRMSSMFNGCSNLENIYVGDDWSTGKVKESSNMFYYCKSLPNFNDQQVDKTRAYAGEGGYLTVKGPNDPYFYFEVNPDNTAALKYGPVPENTPYYNGFGNWSDTSVKGSVTSVTVDASCQHFAGKSLYNLFSGFTALTTINDLENLNTAKVTDMLDMFRGCSKLASLDLSGWNTENVENMAYMFLDCSSLASLDVSSWNTENVYYMNDMFNGCSKLENICVGNGWSTEYVESSDDMFASCDNLPNWNENATDASKAYVGEGGYLTSWTQENLYLYLKVNSDNTAVLRYGQVPADTPNYEGISYDWVGFDENIAKNNVTAITVDESCKNYEGTTLHHLFNGFSALTTINGLTNLYTASVIDMGEMFRDCGKLTSLDFSGWNTASVNDMSYMFSNCLSLASLDLSGWNTGSVNDMSLMFFGCSNLASLTFGEGWNTGSVTDMSGMFIHCWNLESLDLSSWNTASVNDMHEMFNGCSNLKNIYVGNGWSTDKVTEPKSSDDMFASCDNLPNFNSAVVDKTHANTGAGGYLTMKLQAHEGAQGEYWATFYSEISNYQAPEGTQVFTVILDGTSITMKEIEDGIVKSEQGVVLKASTADGINLTPTDKTATGDFSDNSLQGTATSIQNPGNAYVLNYKEGTGAGFYKLSSTGTIGANKAYLTYDAQEGPVGAPAFFSFDNTTGIVEMRNEGNEGNEWNEGNGENAIWYDLNGRRLQGKPAQKGLYIVNGKKVIIK